MVVKAIRPNLAAQVVLLAMLTAATYFPSLRNQFIWDDDDHFTQNPAMTDPKGLGRIWSSLAVSRYYPLTLTNFWIQRRLWGLNPVPYHAVNVAFHAANAALLFLLVRQLNIRGAWVAAAIWAVHPVNVESVAWVTELKNTQSGLFFFMALLFYLQFERKSNRGWYLLALTGFAAALLSKPSTVVLPLVLLLLAWWRRDRIQRQDVVRTIPFFALALAMSLLTIAEQRGQIDRSPQDWSLTLTERLLVAGNALWFYAGKLLWPANLMFIYPRWQISVDAPLSVVPWMGIAGVASALWHFRARLWARATVFGLVFYVVALLPVLGFIDIFFFRYSFVADHFQYLASLGILTVLVAGGAAYLRRPASRYLAAAVSVAGLAVLSERHARIFQDDMTLWQDSIAKNPGAPVAYNNVGVMLNGQKRYAESEEYFRQSLRLKPDFLEARSNLGLALTELGRFEEAEQQLFEALRLKPDSSKAHYCLGHLYYKMKRLPEAEKHFQSAIVSQADMVEAYFDLGTLLLEQNHRDQAAKCYRLALVVRPDYSLANANLAKILAENSQLDEAIRLYQRAVAASPDVVELRCNLAVACRSAGRIQEAIEQLQAALKLNPGFANAYLELGRTQIADRQFGAAIDTFRRGLEMEPRHMIMGNEMAWIMATAPEAELRNAPQAIQIGERLAELTARKEPKPLDTLAAAYAEAGRFEDAAAIAREAAVLAEAQGQTNLASAISSRAGLYANGHPFRLGRDD